MIKELKKELNHVELNGKNLTKTSKIYHFDSLVNHFFEAYKDDLYKLKCIELIQNFTEKNYEDVKKTKIKPLKLDKKNNKVIIEDGDIMHRTNCTDLNALYNFSKGGVLATEWFGEYESQGEGRFCTFLSKIGTLPLPNDRYAKNPMQNIINLNKKPNKAGDIVFYFDKSNYILQKLIDLDYFEYEHKKRTKEDLSNYPNKYKQIIDNLIEPLSNWGIDMHDKPYMNTSLWIAILGGIPPELINGIAIHSKNPLINYLPLINKYFSNAVIFDENYNIKKLPLIKDNNKNFE